MSLLGKATRLGGRGARRGAGAFPAAQAVRTFRRGRGGPSRASVLLAGAAGALGEYFLDPVDGKRRRHVARDKALKIVRRGGAQASRAGQYAGGVAKGAAAEVTPSDRPPAEARLNDTALARKVETEIFRDADVPKGSISVNAEDGVIYLRGEVGTPDQLKELGEAARKVDGVRAVENLLHLPDTPAPSKGDGKAAGRAAGTRA